MSVHLIQLSLLALIITASIIGGAVLVWYSCADQLDGPKLKRDNKGRRRSD